MKSNPPSELNTTRIAPSSLRPSPLDRTNSRRSLIALIGGILFALTLVILIAGPTLKAPTKDVLLLLLFLGSSGTLTVVVSYILYRCGVVNWFRSVRWALFGSILLTVILIFLNVWVTAQLMFTAEHDLLLTTLLLIFAGLSAVSFGFFTSSALAERVSKLALGAEQVAKGNLAARVDVPGNDELAKLGTIFNHMAGELQKTESQMRALEQSRRDLVAWVSHDLRTPLTAIRAMIEALADGVVTDAETTQRYFQNTQVEIRHLNHLIDDLFELAQLDTGQLKLHLEKSSLRDLISDTLNGMHAQADQRKIHLEGKVDPGLDLIMMAPQKMQRVLNNLLNNALRHTPMDGTVSLDATRRGDKVLIQISDTGEGITENDLPHIFDSFFRGEKARRRDDQGARGAGLGLAIAKSLVEAHRGTISVESQPGLGSRFTISLPALS